MGRSPQPRSQLHSLLIAFGCGPCDRATRRWIMYKLHLPICIHPPIPLSILHSSSSSSSSCRAKTLSRRDGGRARLCANWLVFVAFCSISAWIYPILFGIFVLAMIAALEFFSSRKLPSVVRLSCGWRGVFNAGMECSDRERFQYGRGCSESFAEGFFALERSKLELGVGVRWFVATSSLFRIASKFSRSSPKVERSLGVEGNDERSGLGSKVRHGPNLAFKSLNQTGLQDSTKSVILGSLLGDSTLQIVKGGCYWRWLYCSDFNEHCILCLFPGQGPCLFSGILWSFYCSCCSIGSYVLLDRWFWMYEHVLLYIWTRWERL